MKRGIAGIVLILGLVAANMYFAPEEQVDRKRTLVVEVRSAETERPLPGALVRVSGIEGTVLTDSRGRARFPCKVLSSQMITASCGGYETGTDLPSSVFANTEEACLELLPTSPRSILDTAGVAEYDRWVSAHRDTLPGLCPAWVSVLGSDTWPGYKFRVRFFAENGNMLRSIEIGDPYGGVELAGPYLVAGYGWDREESCLVYDSIGRRYLKEGPDSTVVWGPEGRKCFAGRYRSYPGNPTVLVRRNRYLAVGDTIVFLGRDGELINKVVREPQTTTTDADVYRSAGGTSVVAESDFVAYDERGHELWRKSRSGREPIYLSADGSTFARITRDWAGLALVAYDRSGATVARIGITDSYLAGRAIPPFLLTTDFGTMKIDSFYPVKVRLSEHGQFAALYGGHTATLVSITGRKVLWQAAFRDSSEAGGPEILDVRPNAMVLAFTSFYRNMMVCSVHMLVDGRDLDEPIRLRREPDSLWQCTATGDNLVVRQAERFRVYALWR